MRNAAKLAAISALLTLVGASVGFVAGASIAEHHWRSDSVDQGLGCYSSYDGSWMWRQDLRPGLTNERGWVICPLCGGHGEMYIGEPTFVPPVQPPQEMPDFDGPIREM